MNYLEEKMDLMDFLRASKEKGLHWSDQRVVGEIWNQNDGEIGKFGNRNLELGCWGWGKEL